MKVFLNHYRFILLTLFVFLSTHTYGAKCIKGAYGNGVNNAVVLVEKNWIPSPDLGYLMLDGRFGSTRDKNKPFTCEQNAINILEDGAKSNTLKRITFIKTHVKFSSANTTLMGELLEPAQLKDNNAPLLIMVHGSEMEPAIGSSRSMLFSAMGIRVFVYDKRGTGQSDGLYTQNFELLADDAVAAMQRAKEIARGRFGKAGFYGVSQGGWVAPLASTRTNADFVAIGFGLVASPIEEDLDQMLLEAQKLGLTQKDIQQIILLSKATESVVTSHFKSGLNELDALRRELSNSPWIAKINGEYSGDLIRMPHKKVNRVGRAVFDNLELIWDYDAPSTLKKVKVPLLWVLAGDDREAPIKRTMQTLIKLKKQHVAIESFVFPNTDHGMYNYVERKDGSRKMTRVTNGYFQLITDWIKGIKPESSKSYLTLDEFSRNY